MRSRLASGLGGPPVGWPLVGWPLAGGSLAGGSTVGGSTVGGSMVAGSTAVGSTVAGSLVAGSLVGDSLVADSPDAGRAATGWSAAERLVSAVPSPFPVPPPRIWPTPETLPGFPPRLPVRRGRTPSSSLQVTANVHTLAAVRFAWPDGPAADDTRRQGFWAGEPRNLRARHLRASEPGTRGPRRPGDPGTPATRRPGDPETRRPGDPATRGSRRPGDPGDPGDPATRDPWSPADPRRYGSHFGPRRLRTACGLPTTRASVERLQ